MPREQLLGAKGIVLGSEPYQKPAASLKFLLEQFPVLTGCYARSLSQLAYLDGNTLCNTDDVVFSMAHLFDVCYHHQWLGFTDELWPDLSTTAVRGMRENTGLLKIVKDTDPTPGFSMAKDFAIASGLQANHQTKLRSVNEGRTQDLPNKKTLAIRVLREVDSAAATGPRYQPIGLIWLRGIEQYVKIANPGVYGEAIQRKEEASQKLSTPELLSAIAKILPFQEHQLRLNAQSVWLLACVVPSKVRKRLQEEFPQLYAEADDQCGSYKRLVNASLWDKALREDYMLMGESTRHLSEMPPNVLRAVAEAIQQQIKDRDRFATERAKATAAEGYITAEGLRDLQEELRHARRYTSKCDLKLRGSKVELIGKSLTITSVAAMSRAELAHLPDGDEQSSAHDDQEGDSKSRRQERRGRCKAEKKAAKKAAKEAGAGELGVDRGDGNPVS